MDYAALVDEFKGTLSGDKTLKALEQRIVSGKYSKKDMFRFAERTGQLFEDFLRRKCIDVTAVEDVATFVNTYVKNAYTALQGTNLTFAKDMQTAMNAANNIGIKAVTVKPDSDRIANLCQRLIEDPEASKFLLESPAAQNIARGAMTDSISANAELLSDAGMTTYITRDTGGGCCDWCENMAGTYEYGKQPKDFFLAHRNCSCTWTTYSSRGRFARLTFSTDENGRRTRNVE